MKLDPLILRGVEKMGFAKPSPIQEQTIGPLLWGKDVIGQAKTGSGKTVAFSLPLLQSIDQKNRQVQAHREAVHPLKGEPDRLTVGGPLEFRQVHLAFELTDLRVDDERLMAGEKKRQKDRQLQR